MKTDKMYKFLLWEPTTGSHVVVTKEAQTFSEAVSDAYIKQKQLMHTTSKDYSIIGAFELGTECSIAPMDFFNKG